ncbi:hypothetical protein AMS61_10795 [Bacillus sp. FJAT-21351]|nr:hypothetical protein AMS61_10795 [Bacillus sp. FJAT-21351]
MVIVDELYHNVVITLPQLKLIEFIMKLKEAKAQEIEDIKTKISKYEEKKRAEEAWYQSLSPFRKFFTGRPLSQHQAVEYMVYVKERFKKIDHLKAQMRELHEVLELIKAENEETREITLSPAIVQEIKRLKSSGGVGI